MPKKKLIRIRTKPVKAIGRPPVPDDQKVPYVRKPFRIRKEYFENLHSFASSIGATSRRGTRIGATSLNVLFTFIGKNWELIYIALLWLYITHHRDKYQDSYLKPPNYADIPDSLHQEFRAYLKTLR